MDQEEEEEGPRNTRMTRKSETEKVMAEGPRNTRTKRKKERAVWISVRYFCGGAAGGW
jgi:hypothetical protein